MKGKTTLSTIILATTAAAAYWAYAQADQLKAPVTMDVQSSIPQRQSITVAMLWEHEQRRQLPNQQLKYASQVSSLSGTHPDGGVNLDDQGQVIADKDLHRLFDHYLSSRGEMSLQQIKNRLLSISSDFLSLDQLEQVRDLFDEYVNYLAETENFALSLSSDLSLKDQLMAIQDHREQLLGKSLSEAFYGEAHAYASWLLAREAGDIGELTSQQHQWLLQEEAATAYQDAWLQNKQYADTGVSDQQKMILRTIDYGEDVAQRLGALDQRQSAWQLKVSAYIEQRQQLQGDPEAMAQLESQYDARSLKRLRSWYDHHLNNG